MEPSEKREPSGLKLILSLLLVQNVYSTTIDEAAIAVAKSKGSTVYASCIVTPPVTPEQQAWCASVYAVYLSDLQVVNAPYPIAPAVTPSPYSFSQYDICKYETAAFVFNIPVSQPYCPAI